MANENTRNPEPKELIGSKDLRESFKESERIRGSFFINGVELHQFEANSPASVVAQINAKSDSTFVTAEIDDQGHLVLIDRSGGDIMVRQGADFVDPPPASTGDAAKDALTHLKAAAQQDGAKKDEKKKGVLELLGFDATDKSDTQALAQTGVQPGFETGLSADDRRKRWQEQTGQSVGGGYPSRQAAGPAGGGIDRRGAPQIPSNPAPGNLSGAGGKLDDGRGRSGTGGGQGETAGATIAQTHRAPSEAPVPGA